MMRLELATEAYIGARSQQQDAAAVEGIDGNKGAILILADGLGGHESGAEASWIVVDTFRKAAVQGAFSDPARRHRALRDAIEDANTRIAGGVNPAHGHRGMASTAVIAVVAEGELSWISVGDSHLYLWRNGQLKKLNEDHSQAGLMVRSGQFKESDPEVQAVKSVLVSALTGRKLEIVDHPSTSVALNSGDVLILASDGLNTITEDEISSIVAGNNGGNAKALSTALIDAVKERRADRQDNTTVAITRVLSVPKRSISEPAADPLARPRQEITTPTEISPANQRTQIQSPPPKPRPSVSLETTQLPDQPTQRVAASASENPAPVKPEARPATAPPSAAVKSADANARTAIPSAADAPTAIPGAETRAPAAPRPSTELKSDKPMAPIQAAAQPRSRLPLLGLLMLAIATILAGLLIGRMTGIWDPIGALFAPETIIKEQVPTGPAQKRATDRPAETQPPAPSPAIKAPAPPQAAPQPPAQQQPQPKPAPAAPRPEAPKSAAPPPQGAVPAPAPLPPPARPDGIDDRTRPERAQPPADAQPRTESPATPEQQRSQPTTPVAPRAVPPPVTAPDKSGAVPAIPEADPRRQLEAERRRFEQQERARRVEEQRRLQEQEAEFQRRAQAGACNPLSDGSRIPTLNACFRWCDGNTAPGTMDQQECRTWCRGNCPQ